MVPGGTEIISEERILALWRKNPKHGAAVIYRSYVRYLTAIAARYITNDEDVKDVLQDTFLKIFAALNTFRFRGEGTLKGWLAKVTLNETLKFVRRKVPIVAVNAVDNFDAPDDSPDTAGIPAEIIFKYIRQLPDGYRTIFNLYVIEGQSHADIAEMLGITQGTSASQLHRAKAMLAAKLKQYRTHNGV